MIHPPADRPSSSLVSVAALTVVLLAAGLGCGPPRGKNLSEVNERGAKRLCQDLMAQVDRCIEDDEEDADRPSEFAEDCEEYHDDFIEELPDSCEATVGEVRDCYNSCFDDDDACGEVFTCIIGLD